jgi:hypothetical protein
MNIKIDAKNILNGFNNDLLNFSATKMYLNIFNQSGVSEIFISFFVNYYSNLAMIEMFPCFLCLFAFALMNFFIET